MNPITHERMFGWRHGFDHPVTLWVTIAIAAGLVIAPLVVLFLTRVGRIDTEHRRELMIRCATWAVLAPLIVGPILLGAAWTILAVVVMSLWCYREYSRATGLFRHRWIHAIVVIGIVLLGFAALDHWYGFFVALWSLVIIVIVAAAVLPDQPKGYIQRVALAVLGYVLIGIGLGHIAYFANDANFRPILLVIILSVELNDVFAYISGKTFGRRKLAPNTSPNKTIGGAAGALVLTTVLFATLAHFVFRATVLDSPVHLVTLGVIVSVAGQLGDLTLSSIKRDLGIKDMARVLPGHGGMLDRFDSLLLVGPAVFHYVGYFLGVGLDQPTRIFTGN